ncbi:UDP-glucose 4-epimerase GalE [Sulfuricurvum sp.]|uniref:UDP-glucose 4-epimerase GalE n=1 Tax=Sulfuricurvum sp. TaxID=2025608 RepID=UPI00261B0F25|nr:UDP-glucose 4-epimerase GalE [Sulfuricurvum sp.]MDD2781542.1 UDP-glucose 4-epimerase GalE [Sulfuricurvum sp.]
MHILVTGGAGYIGSHVVRQLSQMQDIKITVIDNLCGGYFDSISELKLLFQSDRFEFLNVDLNDFGRVEELFKDSKFDGVIHFAAHLQVGESVLNPLKYYMNNTVNTTHLIHMCQKYEVNKFIFSSTAAVYGEPSKMPIRETTPTAPINPYGMSKLMSELVLQDAARANQDFKYVILRYFNVAGASMDNSIGECHIHETHLIPLIVHAAIGKREKIMMFGADYPTPDGSCIRDYVHVEDLASAHIQAWHYLNEGHESDVFNCGYGHGYSVKEVIDMVKRVSGVNFKVEIALRREGDPAELIADNLKIKNIMGWKPKYDDLELICKNALNWEQKMTKKGT